MRRSLLLLALLPAACSPAGAGSSGGDTRDDAAALRDESSHDTGPDTLPGVDSLAEVAIQGLAVIRNPANVLSFYVEWDTADPATS